MFCLSSPFSSILSSSRESWTQFADSNAFLFICSADSLSRAYAKRVWFTLLSRMSCLFFSFFSRRMLAGISFVRRYETDHLPEIPSRRRAATLSLEYRCTIYNIYDEIHIETCTDESVEEKERREKDFARYIQFEKRVCTIFAYRKRNSSWKAYTKRNFFIKFIK